MTSKTPGALITQNTVHYDDDYDHLSPSTGIRVPPYMQSDYLDDLRFNFPFEEGDVVLVSYPKCGNHWAKGFLPMILNEETELCAVGVRNTHVPPAHLTRRYFTLGSCD